MNGIELCLDHTITETDNFKVNWSSTNSSKVTISISDLDAEDQFDLELSKTQLDEVLNSLIVARGMIKNEPDKN